MVTGLVGASKGHDMHWFIEALKKYAVFSGRARRKEFWYFHLFFGICYFLYTGIP
jgi:uncharacterized membrane protein YhaH (DUF805 family)